MKKVIVSGLLLCSFAALTGCAMSTAKHADRLSSSRERELTAGIVQRDIRKGMSAAEVSQVLGSPNIVSKDKDGVETWIYDKVASEASYSASSGGILSLLIGSRESSAAASTQKSLTVIIKFVKGVVSDYSYHSTKF